LIGACTDSSPGSTGRTKTPHVPLSTGRIKTTALSLPHYRGPRFFVVRDRLWQLMKWRAVVAEIPQIDFVFNNQAE
jgi:hypothetical protein